MPTTDPRTHSTATHYGALRVSDLEREQVAEWLRQAVSEGRLSLTEFEQRLGAAYAARTRDDLDPLTADLPQPPPRDPRPTRPLPATDRRWLAVHAALAAVVAVILVARWAGGPAAWFWPAWPILWLSLSVAVHYRWRRRRWDQPIRPPLTDPAANAPR